MAPAHNGGMPEASRLRADRGCMSAGSPAVMHGVSNFVMVGTGYMFALI